LSDTRYNIYSKYLREKFGSRVYKIPLNLPGTCPNRDGTAGYGGCIFCDEEGAGFQCLPSLMNVQDQVEKNKKFFTSRFNARKFIIYFQSFSNTYMPLKVFKDNVSAALSRDVVGMSISTRPDCVNDEYLDFLSHLKRERNLEIDIELGLQTVNYHTLRRVNRGHTLAEFIDAVLRTHKAGLDVCAHLIINLPWDDITDVVENAKIVSALGIEYVKLHSLYVVEGTVLAEMYKSGAVKIMTLDEYVKSVVVFLEYLDPRIVIQRLVGKGPRHSLLFSNWSTSWWKVKSMIENALVTLNTRQGRHFDYINGPALVKRGYRK